MLKMGHGFRRKGWSSSSTCLQSLEWSPVQLHGDYLTRITKSNSQPCTGHSKESHDVPESIVLICLGTCFSFSELEESLNCKRTVYFHSDLKDPNHFCKAFRKKNFVGFFTAFAMIIGLAGTSGILQSTTDINLLINYISFNHLSYKNVLFLKNTAYSTFVAC